MARRKRAKRPLQSARYQPGHHQRRPLRRHPEHLFPYGTITEPIHVATTVATTVATLMPALERTVHRKAQDSARSGLHEWATSVLIDGFAPAYHRMRAAASSHRPPGGVDTRGAVGAPGLLVDGGDLLGQLRVLHGPGTGCVGAAGVEGGSGDLQQSHARLML
ncbi:hypothetical protein [Streptomyces sp. NPDC001621]|uniref:hypothetical protein n=1 Tax=Streptomyces sp. NPDC001621 TaxID=3364594 RepID=UPI00368D3F68